ncbi:unnamed protein product, partial [marine sediment metagenome]
ALEMFPPEERERVAVNIQKVLTGEPFEDHEYTIVRKDGTTFPALLYTSPIMRDGQLAGLRGIVLNISDRKQTEEALQDSEERFRSLIENSSDALAILNADGTIMYESSSVERIFGEAPDELVGTPFADFIHPDDIAGLTAIFNFLTNVPGATSQFETRFRHKDGTWRWIEATAKNLLDDPKVGGFVVNYRDVTKRKESETALQESEEKLRVMFESIADGISIIDLGGNILEVNEAGARIAGYDRKEELIGR